MPLTDIISQTPRPLGELTPCGEEVLKDLVTQRRVFNRLDWWTPAEWRNSDAFCAVTSGSVISAAMLAVPVSFGDINTLRSSQSSTAWLRWCAVRDGASAFGTLGPLFEFSNAQQRQAGIDSTYCIVEQSSWFMACLREAGFTRVDDVVTMIRRDLKDPPIEMAVPAGVSIRAAEPEDLEDVQAVDASAFEELWHYPAFVLGRALAAGAYFSIAVHGRQVIGYQFANQFGREAHITRLAVRVDWQGRGVGARLLMDALSTLQRELDVRVITLNTQASNHASQRLYRRFGFDAMHPTLRVMRKRLL